MDQGYYHSRAYSIPMQGSHSLYTGMIETSSENIKYAEIINYYQSVYGNISRNLFKVRTKYKKYKKICKSVKYLCLIVNLINA